MDRKTTGWPSPPSLCCLRPPSRHPSSRTTIFPLPAIHSLPPSTTFKPYCTHTFSPLEQTISTRFLSSSSTHLFLAQTISIPCDPLYSLTPFSSSSSKHLFLFLAQTKLLKHFISRTFTFLLSALRIPHASAKYNAVSTITPSYNLYYYSFTSSKILSLILYCSAHLSALP